MGARAYYTRSCRTLSLSIVTTVLAGAMFLAAAGTAEAAILQDPNCGINTLAPNDDGWEVAPLGFELNLGGGFYTETYVVNNGYLAFGSAPPAYFQYWNLKLDTTSRTLIAPFMADVDTRNPASDVVTYGQTSYGGHPAFCVNWGNTNGIGYYDQHADKLNKFQVILVDRSDVGMGDADIIMNYDQVQWDQAIPENSGLPTWIGYTPAKPYGVPGSGSLPSQLIDGQANALISGSKNSPLSGQYIFELRNGVPPATAVVTGAIVNGFGFPLGGASVYLCSTENDCFFATTDGQGMYSLEIPDVQLNGLPYTLGASAPGGSIWQPPLVPIQVLPVASSIVYAPPLALQAPLPPADNVSVAPSKTGTDDTPIVYWNAPVTLAIDACADGSVSFAVTEGIDGNGATIIDYTEMIRDDNDTTVEHYHYTIDAFYDNHGWVTVSYQVTCNDTGDTSLIQFNMYIDPSGNVRNTNGNRIRHALVTLFRSNNPEGPFQEVPDGSAIMSPTNRENPMYSDDAGHFGWDTVPGYYVVRAEKPGCTDASNPTLPYAETDVLPVPPPVTDLELLLDCSAVPPPAIVTPAGLTAEAQSSAGAIVVYDASAWDLVDGLVPVTCMPESGTLFPFGTATVTCTAFNSYGNVGIVSFPVTVTDTTAPSMTLPSDIDAYATSAAGATVWYDATAVDTVDGVIAPVCAPPPASTFSPGETTVQCTATDSHGNTANGTFAVHVTYEFGDILPPLSPDATPSFKQNQIIHVAFTLSGESKGISTLSAKLYIASVLGGLVGPEQPAVSVGNGGNVFKAQGQTGSYGFNLSTKELPAGVYRLRIDLGDAVQHVVFLALTD